MNAESKFPILCRAKEFLQFAQKSVVPTWHGLIVDENLQFIVSGEEEQVALSQLLDPPVDLKERTWESIEAFAAENQPFGLLSCDGSDPASDWNGQSEVKKVTLANRRSNSDLKALLERPFVQQCDLIVSDFLPEESNVNEGEQDEESSAISLPPCFSFVAPAIPPLCRRASNAKGHLLWVVDPSSMVSGLINEKVASILGNMEEDKNLEVICIEPDSSKDLELTSSLAKASAVLAVTGDPALGHFLIRSANQLGIPCIFPLEEPCSPLRFNAEELEHYVTYNNYGRAGLSTRGLLSKAVKRAKVENAEKPLKQRDEQPLEAPSSLWRSMIEERKSGQSRLPSCPNGHDISRFGNEGDFEPVPDCDLPPLDSNNFDVTLTPRPWMVHPNFTQSIIGLLRRSEVTGSIALTSAIADLLSEHLLTLQPDAEVASRLIRNLTRKDPTWLERVAEDISTWRKSGVIVDVARSIWASHTDYNEIQSESLNARKQEFQGLANLLVKQVNSNLVSPYMPNPLFRFLSALNLVEEHMDAISKVFAAHPANDRLYRVLLNFWGLVNGNSEACQTLAPTYSDSSNLNLAHGHLFLFLGIANDSLPDIDEAVTKILSMGYLEKWINGLAWDRLMATFFLALIGLEEEAKQQFDENIASNRIFSPFTDFFANIPKLRSSGKIPLSEPLLDEIRQKLQKKE